MDLEFMRNEIWQNIGEPSDLDPSSDTQYDGAPLLNFVVNEAQRAIANWKDPVDNATIRIDNLKGEFHFKSTIIEGTITDVGTTTTVVLPSGDVGSQDDRYIGWIVKVGSEHRYIVDYDGGTYTATVSEAFSTAPAVDDEYGLYKNFFYLAPSTFAWVSDHIQLPASLNSPQSEGNFGTILRIEDLEQARYLERAKEKSSYISNLVSYGDPTSFYRFGNKLYFNYVQDEEKWFKMEYYRLPYELSSASDESELPEHYHYGIVLWGIWWGHKRAQENSMAYSAKNDFRDFMRSRKYFGEVEMDRMEDYGIYETEGGY